jgi:hypothetical protein
MSDPPPPWKESPVDEGTRVGEEIHAMWPFIPMEAARDYYYSLGHVQISEGTIKIALWVLKRVLDHEKRQRVLKARPAFWLVFEGRPYVPEKKPSKYIVGTGTWLDDENSLSVRRNDDFPESITVWAEDPQIMFPAPERWVLTSRYDRIVHKDPV